MTELEDRIALCVAGFCAFSCFALIAVGLVMLVVDGPWAFAAYPPAMVVLFVVWWKREYVPHKKRERETEERHRKVAVRRSQEDWDRRAELARKVAVRRSRAGTELWDDLNFNEEN